MKSQQKRTPAKKPRPGWEKGSPKRANNITEYAAKEKKQGKANMPGHVRASLNWNTLKRMMDDKYSMQIVDMAQSYNRRIIEIFKKYPNHFYGPALLALQDPEWSLKEIQWCKSVGFNSVLVDSCWPDLNQLSGYPLVSAPRFEEICAECEKNNLVLSIHHAMHQINYNTLPQFKEFGLNQYFPTAQSISLIGFVTSGILDRHPTLKVLISEGGMAFINFSYDILKSKNPNLDIDKYFRNNFYFTIETEHTKSLLSVIKKFGAKRFLFATDYPHSDAGGENKFNDHIDIENLPLSENEKDLICYKNAMDLFRPPALALE